MLSNTTKNPGLLKGPLIAIDESPVKIGTMKTLGIAHIAFGVRDMDRSLSFYRDLLGFKVVRDEEQEAEGTVLPALYKHMHAKRRVTTLYWKVGVGERFLVLSEQKDGNVTGKPIKLDEIGIHHVSFWVEDLNAVYEELEAKGVTFLVTPTKVDTTDGTFYTAFVSDPDGILIQLDELL